MMLTHRTLKKKEEIVEKENDPSSMSSFKGSPNYQIMGSLKKPETKINFEKVPEVKEIILEILKKDFEYWKSLREPTQGIERFNLLNKVCNKLPINSSIFEVALDELMVEQLVVPMELDNKVRFLILCI